MLLATVNPPSRRDNPFATCWTRPGVLPFRFADGQDAEQLIATLAAHDWRGAIVGPHGSGKSTLLETLKPALAAYGLLIPSISLHAGQRRLPHAFIAEARSGKRKTLLVIDGYEQLGWLERLRIARCCRRGRHGLRVTTHTRTRLPTLIELAPSELLVSQLVNELCAAAPAQIPRADIAASHACHDSNVREIFFDLYDRYERIRRAR
jgi:hypothetical protein